jgi:hypothetical protein
MDPRTVEMPAATENATPIDFTLTPPSLGIRDTTHGSRAPVSFSTSKTIRLTPVVVAQTAFDIKEVRSMGLTPPPIPRAIDPSSSPIGFASRVSSPLPELLETASDNALDMTKIEPTIRTPDVAGNDPAEAPALDPRLVAPPVPLPVSASLSESETEAMQLEEVEAVLVSPSETQVLPPKAQLSQVRAVAPPVWPAVLALTALALLVFALVITIADSCLG